jgi:hypothetical protein
MALFSKPSKVDNEMLETGDLIRQRRDGYTYVVDETPEHRAGMLFGSGSTASLAEPRALGAVPDRIHLPNEGTCWRVGNARPRG